MTDDEARKLATRCIDTWPSGPKAYVWRDALIDLDAHYAAATYRRLATEQDRPTVARFVGEYHAIRGPAVTQPARSDEERISLDEYLARLSRRSAEGNTAASDELERWSRWLAPKEPTMRRRT